MQVHGRTSLPACVCKHPCGIMGGLGPFPDSTKTGLRVVRWPGLFMVSDSLFFPFPRPSTSVVGRETDFNE